MDKYAEEFAKKNLEVMSSQEGAMLMMQSLRLGKPLDVVYATNTVTYYNRQHLINYSSVVPYGCWNSNGPEVYFRQSSVDSADKNLRCRPSVRVL